jgi:hypothetical protein
LFLFCALSDGQEAQKESETTAQVCSKARTAANGVKAYPNGGRHVAIVLSRRNLLALLAKLDGHPEGSACTLEGGEDAVNVSVRAETDDVHYEVRHPGSLHPKTQEWITELQN